eukprot:6327-Eustigmatos_ZCMA.PRE.1
MSRPQMTDIMVSRVRTVIHTGARVLSVPLLPRPADPVHHPYHTATAHALFPLLYPHRPLQLPCRRGNRVFT